MRNGEDARFVVQRIDGETLVAADNRRYARSDLVIVQRKTLSGPKTAGLIACIAGGVFVVVMIAVGRYLAENSQ